MKIWNHHTHKCRRFYRLNHAEQSKSKFFLSYYRILHTAYLLGETPCISAVKRMFEETFGLEPKAWSVAYITKTEPCLVNDTIVEILNNSGKFSCPEPLQQMLIEIGFDVYLMQSMDENKKPCKKEFYRWLPLKKKYRLKKLVNNFWKERLPKEKLLIGLGYQLESYKNEILLIYRRLLTENDCLVMSLPEKDAVLAYIDTVLTSTVVPEADTDVSVTEIQEEVAVAAEEVKLPIEAKEEIQQSNIETQQTQHSIIPKTSANCAKVQRKNKITIADGRGFREKNKMTRKKAVTCAVCVAAAGALLVPLVAYTVIKNKS